ncbi:C40 family peptidase [Galbitalea sp. SE-J8]|uniref:C40 family peptidase n=1 Tax=Galbitalea sp. SE-J8 TaxID=3054952 RepID=UPI00259C88DE|nr:C40 family peptidase [Galbitalea sp. SE-J8]MDM4763727.1 C40 family peptidase [Galbitalea sp. SE-J8]
MATVGTRTTRPTTPGRTGRVTTSKTGKTGKTGTTGRGPRAFAVGALVVPALVAGILGAQAIGTTSTADAATPRAHYLYTDAKVIKVAKRYTGTRYRYGGSSPAGFDCSGFTRYVFAQFGIALPHSAAAQGRLGKHVSRKHADVGDLVITSGGAHVGIYVGGNRFIDAPKPGERVHVRTIYTRNHYFVRLFSATRAEKRTDAVIAKAKAAALQAARKQKAAAAAAA